MKSISDLSDLSFDELLNLIDSALLLKNSEYSHGELIDELQKREEHKLLIKKIAH
jgi:hypothetical protein